MVNNEVNKSQAELARPARVLIESLVENTVASRFERLLNLYVFEDLAMALIASMSNPPEYNYEYIMKSKSYPFHVCKSCAKSTKDAWDLINWQLKKVGPPKGNLKAAPQQVKDDTSLKIIAGDKVELVIKILEIGKMEVDLKREKGRRVNNG